MRANGVLRDEQPSRDLVGAEMLVQQQQNLDLACRQLLRQPRRALRRCVRPRAPGRAAASRSSRTARPHHRPHRAGRRRFSREARSSADTRPLPPELLRAGSPRCPRRSGRRPRSPARTSRMCGSAARPSIPGIVRSSRTSRVAARAPARSLLARRRPGRQRRSRAVPAGTPGASRVSGWSSAIKMLSSPHKGLIGRSAACRIEGCDNRVRPTPIARG